MQHRRETVRLGTRRGQLRFGLAALTALLHDVIVTVGFFAIAGTVAGIEIDALFVTAMLTIIGFSVHDTIVVFDRIRENLVRHAGAPFGDIVNHSIVQTLGRSFNTTATVLLTLLTLLVLGIAAARTRTLLEQDRVARDRELQNHRFDAPSPEEPDF